MKYRRILEAFYSTPLALLPSKIAAIQRFLHAKAAGEDIDEGEVERIVNESRKIPPYLADANTDPRAATAFRRADGTTQIGKVGCMAVFGVLSQRLSMIEEASGGVSCERLAAQLDSLLGDKQVRSIVMVFDSPGGSVFGIDELAARIRKGRDEKKIVGMADSLAASAAYYLLSQCSEVNVTPGGMIGSIGVYTAHEDWSAYCEDFGVKTTLVSAGEYKVEASPFAPLSEEAQAEMQKQVDSYYAKFISAVAKGRGVSEAKVKSDFGKGRCVLADDAVAAGMADRVATFDQLLRRQGAYDGGGPSAAAGSTKMAALRAQAAEAE